MQKIRIVGAKGMVVLLLILMTQAFTMILIGQNKQGFFMDEISTYGLANRLL